MLKDVCVVMFWCFEQGSLCRDCYKVICDFIHHHESAINATLV